MLGWRSFSMTVFSVATYFTLFSFTICFLRRILAAYLILVTLSVTSRTLKTKISLWVSPEDMRDLDLVFSKGIEFICFFVFQVLPHRSYRRQSPRHAQSPPSSSSVLSLEDWREVSHHSLPILLLSLVKWLLQEEGVWLIRR